MLAFLTQAATGLGRMYIETSWGKGVAWIFGGYDSCLMVHKYIGIFMICWFGLHLIYLLFIIYRIVKSLITQREKDYPPILYPSEISKRYPLLIRLVAGMIRLPLRAIFYGFQLPKKFYGPDSLLPRLEDLGQALQHVTWMLRVDKLLRFDRWGYSKKLDDMLKKITRLPPLNRLDSLKGLNSIVSVIARPPRFDRWGYWEKFDFWAVFWGIPLLGVTGLIMAYPLVSTRFIPGWSLNVVFWIHRMEAILAICHVFIIHFFIGHLRRHNFPMDQAMFEGSVDLEAVRREKPAWIERLEQSGTLESQRVAKASARRRALFYAFGYAALGFGLFLLIGGLLNSTSITW
jgi:hypothetical protein